MWRFEDFKDTPAAHFCMPAILSHRLLVGVFIGGMAPRPSPNAAEIRFQQTSCLIGVSALFLGYIVVVRPYHVSIANFFEGLVVVSQGVVLSLIHMLSTYPPLADGSKPPEAREIATYVYYIMIISIAGMFLRLVAVMVPTCPS